MKTHVPLLALLLLTGLASSAAAATDAATAASLLRESGLGRALGEIVEQVNGSLHETVAELPRRPEAAEVRRLEQLVDTAFDAEQLRRIASEVLQKEVRAEDLPALRQWFSSPSGRAIAKAESAGSSERSVVERQKREGVLLLERMPEPRRRLLDAVLTASRAVEIQSSISIHSLPALLAAVARAHPELGIPPEKQLLARLGGLRPRIERSLYAGAIEMFAFVYEPVSDADLAKYEALLRSSEGSRFNDALAKALEAAVLHGVTRFGEQVVPPGKDAAAGKA